MVGTVGEGRRGQVSQVSCAICQIHLLEASWEHILPLLRPSLAPTVDTGRVLVSRGRNPPPHWTWHGDGKPGLRPEHW